MADTRKDKRAPISLKVRFKSATLDEFIEQYSADISRGGIFIKSKSPMSVGTLLKFEFRLKDESRLIHGVGRVVWKREEEGDSGKPPGMGIKFIKMDPESRSLVEQMVAKRGDAPGRFEEGQEPEPASTGGGFFPSTTPESELPAPEDRTQVRHASEFLASALAGGGSESASKEAEKKAEEARKRTEEIEKQRAEQAKRKSPRLKKTLVGVGVPDEAAEAPAIEAKPIAPAPAALETEATAESAEAADTKVDSEPPAKEIDESAETVAIDRAELAKEPASSAASTAVDDDFDEHEAETKIAKVELSAFDKAEADEAKADAPEAEEPKAEKPKAETPKPKLVEVEDQAEAAKPAEKAVEERRPLKQPEPAAAAASEEPRSRAGMVFFGVIAAAALGLLVWVYLKPPGEVATDGQSQIGTEPTEPVEEPAIEEPVDELAVEEVEEPAEPVPTVGVQVVTTPAGATVLVDGEARGTSPVEVELPIGQEATVSTQLEGYASASQAITAAEGQEPIELTLTQLAYVIHVETTPPGAQVRTSAGTLTSPGDLTLRRPPTDAIAVTAMLRGYESGSAQVEPADFTETEGRMVATVTLTLTERARPAAPARAPTQAARPPRGESNDEPAGGQASEQAEPAGGSRPSGEQPAGGAEPAAGSEPASGAEPAGGSRPAGGSGGGGGGAEPPAGGTVTPDNPFG